METYNSLWKHREQRCSNDCYQKSVGHFPYIHTLVSSKLPQGKMEQFHHVKETTDLSQKHLAISGLLDDNRHSLTG